MKSLDELMNMDPAEMADTEIAEIVGYLREGRSRFIANERAGIKPRATPKRPAPSGMSLQQLLEI